MPPKWLRDKMQKDYEMHLQRLRQAKSVVDRSAPKSKISRYGKRDIELRLKQDAIDKENHRVVERLLKAMAKKNIDNENTKRENLLRVFRFNSDARRKLEKQRIDIGNRRVLDHIIRANPAYDHVQWEEDAVKHELVLLNMTEFPDLYPQMRASVAPPIIPRPSTAGMLRHLTFLIKSPDSGNKQDRLQSAAATETRKVRPQSASGYMRKPKIFADI